jgi:hypothetical protein
MSTEELAQKVVNWLQDAKAEDDPACRDALLDLRALARAYTNDSAVGPQLFIGLVHAMTEAKGDLARRQALFHKLVHALTEGTAKDDPARRRALFHELRAFAFESPSPGNSTYSSQSSTPDRAMRSG